MKKLTIVGIILLVLGLAVAAVSFVRMGFRFDGLSTEEYTRVTQELPGDFRNISIRGGTAHVVLRRSADGTGKLECMENGKLRHTVSVENGTLSIRMEDERKWYEHFFMIRLKTPELVLCLPDRDYGDLTIENSTGDVEIPGDFAFNSISIRCSTGDVVCGADARQGISVETSTGDIGLLRLSAGVLTVKVSTGTVQLEQVSCRSLETGGSTGKVALTDVTASEFIVITRSTGKVRFNGCDAPEIRIETDTGDVTGTLLTGKTFKAKTDTGKVQVPENAPGGTCEITTDTGDIRITIGE